MLKTNLRILKMTEENDKLEGLTELVSTEPEDLKPKKTH
jgi:hypothetical protein